MSKFLTKVIVEKVYGEERIWKMHGDLIYQIKYNDVIVVPTGFMTDFASVPRIFWAIIPPDGKYTAAAIVHDFLYSTQERGRKETDKIFINAMKSLGVSWWKRNIMYRAVRLFGWIPWRNKEKGTFNIET